MDVAQVKLLLALLTVAAWIALASLGAGLLAATTRRAGPVRTMVEVRAMLAQQGLALALLVAFVATSGSLYLSEVAHFPPCKLCWYQRIAMYPLVPLLGLATLRRDRGIRPYVLVLCGIGAAVSTWHIAVERIERLQGHGGCDPLNPCEIRWVEEFGFITIPVMALTAFALIASIMVLVPGTAQHSSPPVLEETR